MRLILLLVLIALAPGARADFRIDFERSHQAAGFSMSDWAGYGAPGVRFVRAPDRAYVDRNHAHSGRQSLRILFPRGSVGPSEGGHQVSVQLEPAREYCLSYWVKFGEPFSWGGDREGGKLPGLGQGELCSGGQHCDGSNGFTARYMWREGGAVVLYLYHMDKPGVYGQDFPLRAADHSQVRFAPGQWTQLTQRVKINSGTRADGEIQVWVNGAEALSLTGFRLVNDGSLIDTFYVSTFHGGNSPAWGPLHDSYLWIDDIRISTHEGCSSNP